MIGGAVMTTNEAPAEVKYLDLDGDGVPDAVVTREVHSHDVTGDGHVDIVDSTTTIASGIGIDGVPSSVETRSEVFVDEGIRRSA
jgi:hypothetical protein